MTPQDALRLYLSLKAHFSDSSYDFHKYGGQIRWSEGTFERRKDRALLTAICRTTNEEQWKARIIANTLRNGKVPYLDKLMTEDAIELGQALVDRHRDPEGSFRTELSVIRRRWAGSLDDLIYSKNRLVFPHLIRYHLMTLVSADTIIGFDKVYPVISRAHAMLKDDVVWQSTRKMLKLYRGFVKLDKTFCETQINAVFKVESALATTK